MRKKIKLNIKFKGNEVICAKSPLNCLGCRYRENCEKIEVSYNPFTKRDVKECFKNDGRRR